MRTGLLAICTCLLLWTLPNSGDDTGAKPRISTPSTTDSGALDPRPGETRYVYWDKMPEAVRRMGLAQQADLGAVNPKLLRVQKKPTVTIYHIPYEKGSIAINELGIVVIPADKHGGPISLMKWDDLPSAVKNAATSAGEVNVNAVTFQTQASRTLFHILYADETVLSYSKDGRNHDPATFWR